MWRRYSYVEDLPALAVRRRQLRSSLRTVTIAWMFGVVWMVAAGGAQLKTFARMAGFNDFAFGLMAAVPFVATFGQLIAAMIIERSGLRKFQFLHCASVHRLAWLAIAALPLVLTFPGRWAVAATLTVLAVSWFTEALARPAWMTWMGDLIPRRIRGRYMARREQAAAAVQIVAVIVLGILLDSIRDASAPETPQAQPMLLAVICVIFAVAAVFGTVDILLFKRVPELLPGLADRLTRQTSAHAPSRNTAPPDVAIHAPNGRANLLARLWGVINEMLLRPLKEDRVFRNYVGFGATITFSITFGSWYYWLYAMETLGLSYLATSMLFLAIGPLAGLVAARGWGKLIDRWGRRPVLLLSTIGTVLSIVPWLFLRHDMTGPAFVTDGINAAASWAGALVGRGDLRLVPPGAPLGAFAVAALGCIIGGSTWTGLNNAQMSIMLSFSDGHGRSRYVAACGVLISMGGILGGVAGGALADLTSEFQNFGPFLWNNWNITFAVAGLVRLSSLLWLGGLPEPRAITVRSLVRGWRSNVYNAVAPKVFYPLRVFGWGRRPGEHRKPASKSKNDND